MTTTTTQPTPTGQPSLPDLSRLAPSDDPNEYVLLFRARGKGVQIYPSDHSKVHPEAILVTDDCDIIHHFEGPSWRAADGSIVVGTVLKKLPAPADDAIPWLLLSAAAPNDSPVGMLSNVSRIQRVYTVHGNPPSGGCEEDEAGSDTPVFYEAEYYFYAKNDA